MMLTASNKLIHQNKTRLLLMVSLYFIIALPIVGCASQSVLLTTPQNLQVAMDNANQLRLQAEQRVLFIKHADQQISLNGDDYQSAQSLYEAAKDSFDLWINQVQDNLKSGKRIDNTDDYNILVNNANKKSEAFIEYADELLQLVSRGVSKKEIESFIKTGIKLVEVVHKIDSHKRLTLISELDDIRWQEFDAI